VADKEYLAIGRDAGGHEHFYITWTLFTTAVPSVIMLTESTDGVHWRTHRVSAANGCSQGSNPVPAGGTVYVSWEQMVQAECTAQNPNPHQMQMMAAVHVATGSVLRRTVIAPVLGSGDAIVNCNGPTDFRNVIQTAPGHDVRLFELPSTTIDSHGVLYAAWNDRPGGIGGPPSNATRIYLSFSRDGDRTWSKPKVISGPVSSRVVTDRFQPWITVGGGALHAMWYQRVGNGIQTDTENLSLATASAGPRPGREVRVSTVRFPVIKTNPNQDPVISNCYMGDYNKHHLRGRNPVHLLGRQPQRRQDHTGRRTPARRVPRHHPLTRISHIPRVTGSLLRPHIVPGAGRPGCGVQTGSGQGYATY
jgi:hypothetical protein